MFILHEKQNRRTLLLLWCAAGLGLAVALGLLSYNFWMVRRASEDAYASMLWKQSARTADRVEEYIRKMLVTMASITTTDPAQTPPDGEFTADVLAMRRMDDAGQVIGAWRPDDTIANFDWPVELTAEQWANLRQRLPLAEVHIAAPNRAFIAIHAPIIAAGAMEGVLSVLIAAETLVWRCFPPIDEPMISGFALRSRNGQALAEFSRPESNGHLRHGRTLRSEPLFTEPERGLEAYRLLRHADTGYLTATAPAMLPGGVTWTVETAMPLSTVYLAPRALFKSLVILCAWILPLYGLLLLFTIYRLVRTVESEETTRKRSELEHARAHLVALIENIPDIVFLLEPGDPPELSFISARIESLTGLAPVELTASPQLWSNLIAPAGRAAAAQARRDAMAGAANKSIQYQIKTSAGKFVMARELLVPVSDNDGKTAHLIGIISTLPQAGPVADAAPPADAAPAGGMTDTDKAQAADTGGKKQRILLADDDRLLTSLCARHLTQAGYGTTLAYHGMQAVDIFKARPDDFDVVILDMIMPKMSGLEAITHLRQIKPEVKIIGISGYSQDGSEWDLFRHNVAAFLPKPFQPEELLQAIAGVLAG